MTHDRLLIFSVPRKAGLCLAFLALAGCGAIKQARHVKIPSIELLGVDPKLLHRGTDKQPIWVYINSEKMGTVYNKVLIDPVHFAKPRRASDRELAQIQNLADNLYIYVREELKQDYPVVVIPDTATIRIQIAIFDPGKRRQMSNFLTSVVPVAVAVSEAKDLSTGKPLSVGEVSMEAKLSDGMTNEILAAAVDREVGNKYGTKAFATWGDVDEAMRFWARQIRFRLCRFLKRDEGCVNPH